MRRFWLFRSNLRNLEYYHKFKNLKTFSQGCHDFYLLFGLWLLDERIFDEVVIWRLCEVGTPVPEMTFRVKGRNFIQRWVPSFRSVFNYPQPEISFFRGGFKEYDDVVRQNPGFFGKKIYLGAGRRVFPQYGGKYDIILVEDERDFKIRYRCRRFFKTASPKIFHPIDPPEKKKWDICWPCNFTQIGYKGQELFIKTVSSSDYLKSLRIVHCGNLPDRGRKLAKKYGVTNIEFRGWTDRPTLNNILNQSRFGLNMSNLSDGCPRVSTEILMSGTPLLIRKTTRLLEYYKSEDFGVVVMDDHEIETKIRRAMENYAALAEATKQAIEDRFAFETVCKRNVKAWC